MSKKLHSRYVVFHQDPANPLVETTTTVDADHAEIGYGGVLAFYALDDNCEQEAVYLLTRAFAAGGWTRFHELTNLRGYKDDE